MTRITISLIALFLLSSDMCACPLRPRTKAVPDAKLVITCVPEFSVEIEYGGSIVGPRGQLMDGSKIIPVLRLTHEDRIIVIRKPGFHLTLRPDSMPDKTFRFVVKHNLKLETYQLIEVWDGKRRVFAVDLKENSAP